MWCNAIIAIIQDIIVEGNKYSIEEGQRLPLFEFQLCHLQLCVIGYTA